MNADGTVVSIVSTTFDQGQRWDMKDQVRAANWTMRESEGPFQSSVAN